MLFEDRNRLSIALAAAHAIAPKARSLQEGLLFAILALRDTPATAPAELKTLLDTIRCIPELKIFDYAEQRGLRPSMRVDSLFLVEWLLSRAQQVEVETTLADLERYLLAERIVLTEVLAVDGFEVPSSVIIDDFELLPWQSVELTDTKWRVGARHFRSGPWPSVAVTRRLEIPRLHLRPWEPGPAYTWHSMEPMQDLLRCVTAVTGAGVRLLDYWFEPPAWAPWHVSTTQIGVDSTSLCMQAKLTEQVLPTLRACVKRFLELDESRRQRFRVPLERLNNSILAGMKSVDAAVELGIALESLYAPMKLDARIGKALRARASKFLGASAKERGRIGTIVKDTYDLRSHAVHAGRFDSPGARPEWSDAQAVMNKLKEGQDLVGRSLVKMILEGEPAWPESRSGRLC